MIDSRMAAAVVAGKAVAGASRWLRRGGGTTLPGDVALAVDPGLLRKLAGRLGGGVVLVTGTNGKTTTTGLISAAVEAAGHPVLSNRSGANLVFGLAAAAVADCHASGAPRAETAVFEVDELWLERAVVELRPRVVVVLNLLRDQLDRSGELETTAVRIGQALRRLPKGARIVANVDDPLVTAQCIGLAGLLAVGVEADDFLLPGLPHAADARACPRCGSPLRFRRVVLAHCGTYSCPTGDFTRPVPELAISRIQASGPDFLRLTLSDGTVQEVPLGGVYNAYNVLAASAAARALGIDAADVTRGIAGFVPRFGRQEIIRMHGRAMRFMLAKNPAGFDEVLRTADELGKARVYLIAINDSIADGRDVSWLWDVDFELLARSPRHPLIVAAGRRAEDLAVRLKYAGVDPDRVTVVRDPARALQAAAALGLAEEEVAVLPTYTAMLQLRRIAQQAGAVAPYWRRAPQ